MELQNKYIKFYLGGMIGGLSEVILLHPIDFIKTKIQDLKVRNIINNKPRYFKKLYNQYGIKPFLKGFMPRIYGITPMRTLYFGTMTAVDNYLQDRNIKNTKLLAGLIAGSVQTLIDCPLENYKTKQILGLKNIFFFKGFTPHILRNIGFSIFFFTSQNYFKEQGIHPLIGNAIAGFFAAFFTHPFDVWKTFKQGELNYNWKTFTRKDVLMSGLISRSTYTLCSMMIGFSIHNYLIQNL